MQSWLMKWYVFRLIFHYFILNLLTLLGTWKDPSDYHFSRLFERILAIQRPSFSGTLSSLPLLSYFVPSNIEYPYRLGVPFVGS